MSEFIRPVFGSIVFLLLSGCTTLDGPVQTFGDRGPISPYGKTLPAADDHVPLFDQFKEAWNNSVRVPANGSLAKAMVKSGAALIRQNCVNYFDSNGRTERYLLFGRDVTTFTGAVATAALTAANASKGSIAGVALATTNLISGNDVFRKQLTYGADFTNSAKTMVLENLNTFETALASKSPTDYDFATAVGDLRDLQDVCMPATIVANMSTAIATKKFNAIVVQPAGSPPSAPDSSQGNSGTSSAGAPPTTPVPTDKDKSLAAQLKGNLTSLQAKGLLKGLEIEKLNKQLDSINAGETPPTNANPLPQPSASMNTNTSVPSSARIRLVPQSE